MTALSACRPRTKNAAATRQAMLVAARRRFLQESYENVGLRDIAGDVGVDVALVGRYFGSKEALFREVLRGEAEEKFPPDLDPRDLPARLTALVTEHDSEHDRENVERLLIILRSASSPVAAEIVREALHDNVLTPLASMLRGPDAEERASVALAILMGSTVLRTVMSVEPLCQEECRIGPKLTQLFETALSETPAPLEDVRPG